MYDYIFYNSNVTSTKYLDLSENLQVGASFYYLLNTIIPISVMVNYDISKFCQILFFLKDPNMYPQKDSKITFNSLNIQENLGEIKYIFSDKTGTLTKNEMKLSC